MTKLQLIAEEQRSRSGADFETANITLRAEGIGTALYRLVKCEEMIRASRIDASNQDVMIADAIVLAKLLVSPHTQAQHATFCRMAEQKRDQLTLDTQPAGPVLNASLDGKAVTQEYKDAVETNAPRWVPACGGIEIPTKYRNGVTALYVFMPESSNHGYLNVDTDVIMTDDEVAEMLRS